MKKFKLVFRLVFLGYILLSILISIFYEDLINHGFLFWKKGMFSFLDNMMVWGLIGGIIFFIEFALENWKIISLKKQLDAKEADILKLKAQLFDQQGQSSDKALLNQETDSADASTPQA